MLGLELLCDIMLSMLKRSLSGESTTNPEPTLVDEVDTKNVQVNELIELKSSKNKHKRKGKGKRYHSEDIAGTMEDATSRKRKKRLQKSE